MIVGKVRVIFSLTLLFSAFLFCFSFDLSPLTFDLQVYAQEEQSLYYCPMHPSYTSDKPGNCPICQMKLVPMRQESQDMHSHPSSAVAGRAAVMISPEKQQLIGVKSATVELRPLEKVIRTVGILEHDQTKEVHIHTKVAGLVEELFVTYDGQHVKKGEAVYSIYSPDLVSTQEEYLLALRNLEKLSKSPLPEIQEAAKALVEATKRRLILWDVDEKEIEEVTDTGKPKRAITFYSPISGVVVAKHAVTGEWFDVGGDLYHLVDLMNIWVIADVYEYELGLVQVGQEAEVEITSFANERFKGKISFVNPHLDMMTRTAKVRIEIQNPEHRLQPGMFANVILHNELGEKLALPESSVMDTGVRRIVFVDLGEGRFEPREVKLGQRAEGHYEVLDGIHEGEKVVTSGNFLIDSESQLKAAIGTMGSMSDMPGMPGMEKEEHHH